MRQEWFRTAFGSEYLSLYAHRDEVEAQAAAGLICKATGVGASDIVLDAPCGAGRHARAFTGRGLRVCALDLSRELLTVALKASNNDQSMPYYVHADLRAIPFSTGSFQLVANLFSSFGYFNSEEANLRVLSELARVCKAKGHVVIDFMNAAYVEGNLEPRTERVSEKGCHVVEERWIEGAPPRVNKRTVALSINGDRLEFFESVRLYKAAELEAAMDYSGLGVTMRFGDYQGGPVLDAAPRVILIGSKR